VTSKFRNKVLNSVHEEDGTCWRGPSTLISSIGVCISYQFAL
jgi:hypothetical protein